MKFFQILEKAAVENPVIVTTVQGLIAPAKDFVTTQKTVFTPYVVQLKADAALVSSASNVVSEGVEAIKLAKDAFTMFPAVKSAYGAFTSLFGADLSAIKSRLHSVFASDTPADPAAAPAPVITTS